MDGFLVHNNLIHSFIRAQLQLWNLLCVRCEVLIPFIGRSPHGMMNASALETGPGFHSA